MATPQADAARQPRRRLDKMDTSERIPGVPVVTRDLNGSLESDGEKDKVERRLSVHHDALEKKVKRVGTGFNGQSPKPQPEPLGPKDICEELRRLVKQDDSDEAFEKFRTDKAVQDAFKTEKERKASRSQTGSHSQSSKGNILHYLVGNCHTWEPDDISKVLARILKRPKVSEKAKGGRGLEELLEEDPGDGTPMFLALAKGHVCNPRFVNALLKLDPAPSNLGQVLCKKSSHHKEPYCLHATLNSDTRCTFADIKKIINLMCRYKPPQQSKGKQSSRRVAKPVSPFEDTNRDGNTALHLAVRAAPVPGGARESDNSGEPQFFTGQEALELIEDLVEAYPKTLGVKNQVPADGRSSMKRPSTARTPYQERIFQLAEQFKRDTRINSVPVPNDHRSNSNYNNVEEHDTAAQDASLGFELEAKQPSVRDYLFRNDFRKYVSEDPVASYISSYCIRRLRRDQAMSYLYRRGEELLTEFDLLGFPRKTINETYLKNLETHVRFEQTLKYVALPRLVYVPPTAAASASQE